MFNKSIDFWIGDFGKKYMKKYTFDETHKRQIYIEKILQYTLDINSILEIGCNVGINIKAIKNIGDYELYGIEPFKDALDICIKNNLLDLDKAFCTNTSNMKMFKDNQIDLVFTSMVLMYIPLPELKIATDNIVRISKKYILCCELSSNKKESTYIYENTNVYDRNWGDFYTKNYKNLELINYNKESQFSWWLFKKI